MSVVKVNFILIKCVDNIVLYYIFYFVGMKVVLFFLVIFLGYKLIMISFII